MWGERADAFFQPGCKKKHLTNIYEDIYICTSFFFLLLEGRGGRLVRCTKRKHICEYICIHIIYIPITEVHLRKVYACSVGYRTNIIVFCSRYSGIEMHIYNMAFLSRLLVCSPMGLKTGCVPHFSFTREWRPFLWCRAQLLAGEMFGGRCLCVCVDYTP